MFLYFSTWFHTCSNICHKVLQASACLSRRRLPPVRITSLELFISSRHLWRSACRKETLWGSGISENHSARSLECTMGGQSVPIQKIWSDHQWSTWTQFITSIFPSIVENSHPFTHFAATYCIWDIHVAYLSINFCCWNILCCEKPNRCPYFTVGGMIDYFQHFEVALYLAMYMYI